ncbi:hypothetical protein [Streptomyces sp. NPDC002537]
MKNRHRLVTLVAAAGLVAGGVFFTSSASAGTAAAPSPKRPGPAGQHAFASAALSQTLCWPGVRDEQLITWYGAPVTSSQPVVASASEGVMYGEGAGDAHVYAEGVTVLNSAVIVRVHTGWGSPLNVCIHFVG